MLPEYRVRYSVQRQLGRALGQTPSAYGPQGPYSPVPPAPPWAGTGPASDAHPRRTAGWRRPLSVVLLVVGCAAMPLALASLWVHANVMNVDGYVSTITPVADEPAVQKTVADVLADQISGALGDGQSLPLPDEVESAAGVLSEPLGSLTRTLTEQAVQSPAFRHIWAAANREIHPVLVAAVRGEREDGGGAIALDLSAVTGAVTDLLTEAGVELPDPLPKALRSGDVVLLDSGLLASAGRALATLDRLYLILGVGALAALAGGVVLARDRRRAGVAAGAGVALGMAALEVALWAGGSSYLRATDDAGVPHDASAAVWSVVTSSLTTWGWIAAAVAGGAAAGLILLKARRRRG
jgi:hypothetical protein